MATTEMLTTHQKAPAINLDPTRCGSWAEIGVGQRVVRWFLVVSGTSGIFANSISAHDKEVRDDLYDPSSAISRRESVVPYLPIAAAVRTPHGNREAA